MIADNEIRDLWTEKCAAKCGYDALIIDFARAVEAKTKEQCAQICDGKSCLHGKFESCGVAYAAAIRGMK